MCKPGLKADTNSKTKTKSKTQTTRKRKTKAITEERTKVHVFSKRVIC